MGLMVWSERLSVGVKAIDDEHVHLVEILNQIHQSVAGGQPAPVCKALLDEFVMETRAHFSSEETTMSASRYPGLSDHHDRHQDLLQQADQIQARLSRRETMVDRHLVNMLRNWLTLHILVEDQKYGAWLEFRAAHETNESGVEVSAFAVLSAASSAGSDSFS